MFRYAWFFRISSGWAPVIGVGAVIIVLGTIGGVVVLSLIALYTPNKGDGMVVKNNKDGM